jgi:hypothetical protein
MGSAHHSESLKREIARLLKRGAIRADVCRDYKLAESTVRKFIRQVEEIDAKNAAYEALKRDCGVKHVPKAVETVNHSSKDTHNSSIASFIWIGDLHAPFMHQDAFHFCKELKSVVKPREVAFAGDETDQHAHGKYATDPNGMAAGEEMHKAIEQLIPFYKEFPVAKVCESNHGTRAYKKAFDAGIAPTFLRRIEEVMNAPEGWTWADHWIIDDVFCSHGDPYSGRNAVVKHMHENFMSVAIGHTHSYGRVEIFQTRFRRFFALDGGCLIDPPAYAFKYAGKMNRRPTLGSGVVYDRENAEFVSMNLDHHGRWTGKIKLTLA